MRVLTGEEPEDNGNAPAKNQAAAELGRKGGEKRAECTTPERPAEIRTRAQKVREASIRRELMATMLAGPCKHLYHASTASMEAIRGQFDSIKRRGRSREGVNH
jgi:hypothetical protein